MLSNVAGQQARLYRLCLLRLSSEVNPKLPQVPAQQEAANARQPLVSRSAAGQLKVQVSLSEHTIQPAQTIGIEVDVRNVLDHPVDRAEVQAYLQSPWAGPLPYRLFPIANGRTDAHGHWRCRWEVPFGVDAGPMKIRVEATRRDKHGVTCRPILIRNPHSELANEVTGLGVTAWVYEKPWKAMIDRGWRAYEMILVFGLGKLLASDDPESMHSAELDRLLKEFNRAPGSAFCILLFDQFGGTWVADGYRTWNHYNSRQRYYMEKYIKYIVEYIKNAGIKYRIYAINPGEQIPREQTFEQDIQYFDEHIAPLCSSQSQREYEQYRYNARLAARQDSIFADMVKKYDPQAIVVSSKLTHVGKWYDPWVYYNMMDAHVDVWDVHGSPDPLMLRRWSDRYDREGQHDRVYNTEMNTGSSQRPTVEEFANWRMHLMYSQAVNIIYHYKMSGNVEGLLNGEGGVDNPGQAHRWETISLIHEFYRRHPDLLRRRYGELPSPTVGVIRSDPSFFRAEAYEGSYSIGGWGSRDPRWTVFENLLSLTQASLVFHGELRAHPEVLKDFEIVWAQGVGPDWEEPLAPARALRMALEAGRDVVFDLSTMMDYVYGCPGVEEILAPYLPTIALGKPVAVHNYSYLRRQAEDFDPHGSENYRTVDDATAQGGKKLVHYKAGHCYPGINNVDLPDGLYRVWVRAKTSSRERHVGITIRQPFGQGNEAWGYGLTIEPGEWQWYSTEPLQINHGWLILAIMNSSSASDTIELDAMVVTDDLDWEPGQKMKLNRWTMEVDGHQYVLPYGGGPLYYQMDWKDQAQIVARNQQGEPVAGMYQARPDTGKCLVFAGFHLMPVGFPVDERSHYVGLLKLLTGNEYAVDRPVEVTTNVQMLHEREGTSLPTDPNFIWSPGPGHYFVAITQTDQPQISLHFAQRPKSVWLCPTTLEVPVTVNVQGVASFTCQLTDWTKGDVTTKLSATDGTLQFTPHPDHAYILEFAY